jgi:hypothetical protein
MSIFSDAAEQLVAMAMIRPMNTTAVVTLIALVAPGPTPPSDDTPLETAEAACTAVFPDAESSLADGGWSLHVEMPRTAAADVVNCLFDELLLPTWPIFLMRETDEDDGLQHVEVAAGYPLFDLDEDYDLWWRWDPGGTRLSVILVRVPIDASDP